mgnify:CR=1 FL=1
MSGGPDRSLLEDAAGDPIGPDGRRLTPEQADVVLHRDGPLMVAANAGSGKTTVLVERFVRHVVDDGIDPRSILAITFTRRAAGQLRERIRARLLQIGCGAEAQAMEAAWISTIDGFCLRVLSSHAVVAGLDPTLTVLDPAELRPLREHAWEEALGALLGRSGTPPPGVLDVVDRFGYDRLRGLVSGLYDELRSRGLTRPSLPVPVAPSLDDAPHLPALAALDDLLTAYGDALTAAKRARRGLDYADLAVATRDLLKARPEIAAGYAERLQRVMVDEFQDTNRLQVELLEALGQEHRFLVGDRLQAIYGFRHADVRGFDREWEDHRRRGCTRSLARNFRSSPPILEAINAALGPHQRDYAPLEPGLPAPAGDEPAVELLMTDADAWKALPPGDPLALALASGMPPSAPLAVRAEARLVAQRVQALLAAGRPAGDVVILLRAGTHMAAYERALELAGVPAVATQGRGWWSRREVQDLINHLRVVVNPLDEPALLGALAAPLAGLGTDDLARLALTRRARNGAALWDVAAAAAAGDEGGHLGRLDPAARAALAAYVELVGRERRTGSAGGPAELLGRAIEQTGYDVHALQGPGGLRRMANVRKLIALADAYAARSGPDLRGFADLATAELEAGAPTPDAPLEVGADQAVRLMTIHGSKGLEFPVVIVADLGRTGGGDAPAVLVDGDHVGLRLPGLHDEQAETAFDFERLDAARVTAEIEEERRVLHVAVTRAQELLVLSGTFGADKGWGEPGHKRPALTWMGPGLFAAAGGFPPAHGVLRIGEAQARVTVGVPGGQPALPEPAVVAPASTETLLTGSDVAVAAATGSAPAPAPPTLSYSSLATYARCGYSWYLRRVLDLPERDAGAAADGAGAGDTARRRGSIAHAVLERAELATGAPHPDATAVRAAAAAIGEPLHDDELPDQLRLASTFLDGPWRARAAAAADVRREVGFALPLDVDGDDAPLLNGVIDLLAREQDGRVLVIDHKTDRVAADADVEALVARDYAIQRAIYALAALRAGAPTVEVVHLYLDRGEAAVATYTTADAPELEDVVRGAAAPLLAGDYPVAAEPHLGLCRACPGRHGLCSHPAELTDRPSPAAG